MKLSKSLYMKASQCEKALWFHMNQRHLAAPIDASKQALFDQGHEVGRLAQTLYPEGKEIAFSLKPFSEKFKRTWDYINSGVPNIYEATFQTKEMMCMVDILHKGPEGWELIEVKSSTSEKEQVIHDIAVQYHVVTEAGLPISKVKLMYINNQYTRSKDLDLHKLFMTVDVTEKILALQETVANSKRQFTKVMASPDCPKISIGPQCNTPYDCDYKDHCWKEVPEDSVFTLARLPLEEKFALYYQGVMHVKDIPPHYSITPSQDIQIQAEQSQDSHLDKRELKRFLETIYYPLYFLDFESFSSPIPPYEGIRPYQQIPFQYSLHALNSPFDQLSHFEFLAKEGTDPREELAKRLVKEIPENTCVLVYNKQFEKSIIEALADLYPKLREPLLRIAGQLVDLMIPFKEKWVYYPEMRGSYSIKKVLPALVPDLNYEDLVIGNGADASLSYAALASEENEDKRRSVREALLEYCKLDTFAMIKIHEQLLALLN